MSIIRSIGIILLLFFSTKYVSGTTWSAAYPYKQHITGQKVIVKAVSFDPYYGITTPGSTKVYFKGKFLYSINKYYRGEIFTSDDGKFLVVVNTSNIGDRLSYSKSRPGKIDFDLTALEIYKNGKLYKNIPLKQVIDTSRLVSWGRYFSWGYDIDSGSFEKAEIGCESCIEVYGKKVLRKFNAMEIDSSEWKECKNECDSVKLLEIEKNTYANSIFVDENSLYILTNQNHVVKYNFETMEIQQIPYSDLIPHKEEFSPPRLIRKYKKVKLPDQFDQPRFKNGHSLEEGISELFGLSIPGLDQEESYSVFINVLLDKKGECVKFYGRVYDRQISEFFTTESINMEMTDKLNTWIQAQKFETTLIPKGFKRYSFRSIVDLK